MHNIYEKIEAGEYNTKIPYASYRKDPVNWKIWDQDDKRLLIMFRNELEAMYNVVGNPKADQLWALAWAHGHSGGLADVLGFYDDMVVLIK